MICINRKPFSQSRMHDLEPMGTSTSTEDADPGQEQRADHIEGPPGSPIVEGSTSEVVAPQHDIESGAFCQNNVHSTIVYSSMKKMRAERQAMASSSTFTPHRQERPRAPPTCSVCHTVGHAKTSKSCPIRGQPYIAKDAALATIASAADHTS
ncbi:hypothetical protein PsorP6_014918 [Peronosclerospora sorghi]|uniref:Uncharacterized protein n=1 Tax=Peronosclerospora sorghi TaxID=230839 RepID=A0ACC0VSZ7_9STRA|nr:hypothetical protein PsorP6_014918 [Peronosclerospora sorghi]